MSASAIGDDGPFVVHGDPKAPLHTCGRCRKQFNEWSHGDGPPREIVCPNCAPMIFFEIVDGRLVLLEDAP